MCGSQNGIFEVDKCVIELILEIVMETKLGQEDTDRRCDGKNPDLNKEIFQIVKVFPYGRKKERNMEEKKKG